MTTWIKPAVGWVAKCDGEMLPNSFGTNKRIQEATWGRKTIAHVAIVSYSAAKMAGLLRRPK